jgi:hypothetical protein
MVVRPSEARSRACELGEDGEAEGKEKTIGSQSRRDDGERGEEARRRRKDGKRRKGGETVAPSVRLLPRPSQALKSPFGEETKSVNRLGRKKEGRRTRQVGESSGQTRWLAR